MAYFANGSEGMHMDTQCDECLHGCGERVGCPVAFVQMHFNYDQCAPGQEKLRECLTMLVGEDGNCRMKALIDEHYKRRNVEDPNQMLLFEDQ